MFLKVEDSAARTDVELAAMERSPVPVPEVLWRRHPVLALARVPGHPLEDERRRSTASAAAWEAAGRTVRELHEQPSGGDWPAWYGDEPEAFLAAECAWLVERGLLGHNVVEAARAVADAVLRPFHPVVIHGDLQPSHVFVEDDAVVGVIDWADACLMDPLFDLAVLTVDHPERLGDVLEGYGGHVDREVVEGWWAFRRLGAVRWLLEHGYDASTELAALRAHAGPWSGPEPG